MSDYSSFLNKASKTISKKAEVAEIDIEDHFVTLCSNAGCKALKLVYLSKRGFPDRTVICPGGLVFFVEFKRKGKSASHSQIKAKNLLESYGFKWFKCDTLEQCDKILNGMLDR